MKVLLTGNEGYLGTTTENKISDNGYEIVPYDIRSGRDIRRLGELHNSAITQNVDAIVHMAGVVGENDCKENLIEAYKTNVEGTRHIIRICETYKIPLIFLSTCSVYGDSGGNEVNPISYYALSKWISEREIREKLSNYFILRLGTAYGYARSVADKPIIGKTRNGLVVNKMAMDALEEGKVTVFGGRQRRPFVSALSVSRSVCNLLEKFDQKHQETFDVVEFSCSIKRLGEQIGMFMDVPVEVVDKETDGRDYERSGRKFCVEVMDLPKRLFDELKEMKEHGF